MHKKIAVGILGSTGIIGQNLLALLENHPWFEVKFLTAKNPGPYETAIQGKWLLTTPHPNNLQVNSIDDIDHALECCRFVFSALPSHACHYEQQYAARGLPVISLASYHREQPDIPVLIPEVNPEHLEIIPIQKKNRGWKRGFIVTKPNCALQACVIALTPLLKYGLNSVWVTSLQSISGAGATGLFSHQIHDNVIPYISGEEEKMEKEPLKIWGKVVESAIVPDSVIKLSAHCNRIPVLNGHLCCISAAFSKNPCADEIIETWKKLVPLKLPSAPQDVILYKEELDRPQIRLDRDNGNGMSVTIGRLRPCPLANFRFTALSHNAVRGGSGGAVLIAELLHQKGYFD